MLDKALFLISMVISFYITIRAIQHFTYSDETFTSFVNQVNTGYIEDIIIADQCPSGYDILLNNFEWPGTLEGCGCKKDNSTYTFYTSECEHLSNCEKVEETKAINLSKWKSSNFCVKKEKMNVAPLVEQKKKIKSEIINDLSGVLDKVILAKVAVGTPDMNEILKEISGNVNDIAAENAMLMNLDMIVSLYEE